jgi:hypothetical protein
MIGFNNHKEPPLRRKDRQCIANVALCFFQSQRTLIVPTPSTTKRDQSPKDSFEHLRSSVPMCSIFLVPRAFLLINAPLYQSSDTAPISNRLFSGDASPHQPSKRPSMKASASRKPLSYNLTFQQAGQRKSSERSTNHTRYQWSRPALLAIGVFPAAL